MSALREDQILISKDVSLLDDTQWEEFELKRVQVFENETCSKLVNLFDANLDKPLVVRGYLQKVEPEQEHLVLNPGYTKTPIEITGVLQYALAQFVDGTLGVWAAGKAGWYEVSPAASYKGIYAVMIEGVKLWYFVQDCHTVGNRLRKKSLENVVQAIVASHDWAHDDEDEAQELLKKHSSFLQSQMQRDVINIKKWEQMPLWIYLKANNHASDSAAAVNANNATLHRVGIKEETVTKTETSLSSPPPISRLHSKHSAKRSPHAAKGSLRPKPKVSKKVTARRAVLSSGNEEASSDDERETKRLAIEDQTMSDAMDEAVELPLKLHPDPNLVGKKTIDFEVVPLPSTKPQGPGDVWTCTVDGCVHRIYAGSDRDGQKRIREHLAEHIPETKRKLALVVEESRLRLPVQNLVDRIRFLAQQYELKEQAAAQTSTRRLTSHPKKSKR
ncbi:MAG: hypothetical protein M1817_005616 [Caeruleum heppii]|nr:MAG: hypothetical protein M1817_005616 [Caeruleum heppii]